MLTACAPAAAPAAPCAQVDCTQEVNMCRSHFITGFPSIRVFRKGHDDIYMGKVWGPMEQLPAPRVLVPHHPAALEPTPLAGLGRPCPRAPHPRARPSACCPRPARALRPLQTHEHEAYTGNRTKQALVEFADNLVPGAGQPHRKHMHLAAAPKSSGCNMAGGAIHA